MMFRGRSNHTLDDKGRLAIPARFREVLEQKGDMCLMVTSRAACLWAFARDDWQILEEKAANLPLFDEAGIAFLRGFISSAVECHVKSGRITIPPSLREDAGLKKEVVLAGQLKKFEIWNRERWEEEFERVKNAFPGSSPSLLELRI
ncbi:MAG: division/cell wall cluster transcriptional repressor MraZ [Deltaproteobacteria bacterium]|nr:division/cell wall cluster transcriptional repressor MraZ [Deltaproteobacteria bacterium]MBW2047149.1 division/cell wall cluster transcriptional repressor MraZ [Deltaproteobacteria bacterium]MBW2109826.1 division/cell wall cluster transcriptional repressor MraZ [Deltaproteobacteria bacterium]MBW2352536.1 division/cell wall cluster transcriptional repressor MraZ [Deltaproteobacteria bacterium]HDZ89817.1 division/cell wall cluster transcriptional repressor MraZ [Deltaproteobacteria bacterium]